MSASFNWAMCCFFGTLYWLFRSFSFRSFFDNINLRYVCESNENEDIFQL